MASGVTTQALLDALIDKRRQHMRNLLLHMGAKEKRANEASDDVASGMRQMAADLQGMGVIEVVKE